MFILKFGIELTAGINFSEGYVWTCFLLLNPQYFVHTFFKWGDSQKIAFVYCEFGYLGQVLKFGVNLENM